MVRSDHVRRCLPSFRSRSGNGHHIRGAVRCWLSARSVASLLWLLCVWGGLAGVGEPLSAADRGQPSLPAGDAAAAPPKFELDVQPILTARACNSGPCHGKARGQNGFALSLLAFDAEMDFEAIVTQSRGRRLAPSAPGSSLLLAKATGQLPHGGGVRIEPDSDEYRLLARWIESGTPRVSPEDPVLVGLEITPEPHTLSAGQEEALTVTARYSDGSTRDVTTTCAYQSNEPVIVAVAPDGRLTAGKLPGEATVMARYMGLIATWSTAVPRPQPVDPSLYASLPRANFIDDLVYRKLAELNIEPSEPCDDAQYLRRAYLDVIGRLPTPEEARQFLQDSQPDKRARLVDALLERPEYADFWANKWADLLRPNPYRVGIKATLSLDVWLRDIFRANLPYDQFVTRLLTAQGSNWRNGAVTVFRDRREPEEITTMISQLFLGVRLDCAKCHQHPFEVYGQKDFYSLAAYFSRVGYKGTGLSPPISGGEEMVLVKAQGEVRHPLTKEVLPPKPLLAEAEPLEPEVDPRAALAAWMTAPENPYFARVAANRIWADLMGMGLVDPVDDLRATNPPSNPELLTALAEHYREVGYDTKEFLRTILGSRVYALSSRPNASNASDYRNFSRHYRKRLRAEVLADAICDITQVPESYAAMPAGSRAMEIWTHRTDSELLDTFGRPDPNQDPPCERTPDATMTQALHLMNAPRIHQKISHAEGRAARLAESDAAPQAMIEELYLAVYSRLPDATELEALTAEYQRPGSDRRRFVEDLLWSLLNTPEFVYID
jgi:hypothetical protein